LSPPVDITETSLGGRFSADKSFDCKDLQQFFGSTASSGGGGRVYLGASRLGWRAAARCQFTPLQNRERIPVRTRFAPTPLLFPPKHDST